MRPVILSTLLLVFAGCTKNEVQPPEVAEIPEAVVIPEKESAAIVNSVPALPEPLNPSGQPLILKQLKNNFTMYTPREFVDTTVYHYNTKGEVTAEFSTYLNVGDSKVYSGYRKYHANPDNINIPDKIYATVLTSVNNYTKTDFIYCDDQKRVIREVKDGSISYSYEYDHQGRLSRIINEYNKEVSLYSYFSRNETEEDNAYYLVQVFPQGSTAPNRETKYVLSNTIKSPSHLNYFFNYGKVQEYAVEREVINKEPLYSYSYVMSDDKVSEKKFKAGKHDFWVRFVY